MWQWKEDRALLDDVFPIDPQFIPETDPTGSKNSEDTLVPIENSLYGSNFMGGYYLCEMFSAKNYFSKHLTRSDIKKIQEIIDNCKLGFKLERLSDRVGNIVCKVPMDMIKHKSLKLSPERGISGTFKIDINCQKSISCIMQIIIENDNTIIDNRTELFVLSEDLPEKEYTIAPNRYKNTIILTDEKTGIIYYSAVRDYSFGSDYYSTIKPPHYIVKQPQKRTILIDDCEREIGLTNLVGIGKISIEKEIFEMEKRQTDWKKEYEHEHFYFRSFQAGQEKEAIHTVIEICNDKELLWDLKEIWLVDPYLSADDILKTVVYCEKYGIDIKCLTRISTINNNTATKIDATECMSQHDAAIEKFSQTLENALIKQYDMKIEFRTAIGISFHDRYLILKYGINRPRVWSLGISVNALGTSHHIIQIVQSPDEVVDTIDDIWEQSGEKKCLIYKK